jgi:hypothetical protein
MIRAAETSWSIAEQLALKVLRRLLSPAPAPSRRRYAP